MSETRNIIRPGREDYKRALESMDTFIDIGIDDLLIVAQRAEVFADQRATERIVVKQIMSQPVHVVHPETRMSEAAHLMVTERISGLPVVDAREQLIGIITEADFLRGLGVPAHHPSHNLWQTLEAQFVRLNHHADLEAPDDPVAEHMVAEVISASPEDDVHSILGKMKSHKVKRLIICDNKKEVKGIVTRSDLMRIFFDRYLKDDRVES